ncbi:MAG: hypothetical protein UT90_C0008G0001 [Parcubacteria group bacterium GW2011_GWA1_40_21]|nr:MAG: hypothetical protein UT90_C0008G0001 [Parcubacteria group bacterium GW2011_GWA1_40_21]
MRMDELKIKKGKIVKANGCMVKKYKVVSLNLVEVKDDHFFKNKLKIFIKGVEKMAPRGSNSFIISSCRQEMKKRTNVGFGMADSTTYCRPVLYLKI